MLIGGKIDGVRTDAVYVVGNKDAESCVLPHKIAGSGVADLSGRVLVCGGNTGSEILNSCY